MSTHQSFDVHSLPTPSMVIDAQRTRRNIQRMAAYAEQHGLKLRPHIKTHKSLFLASMQMEHGAQGLTVAKVGEAEIMQTIQPDLLLAYPVADPHRAQRVARLAGDCDIKVAVDSSFAVDALQAAAARQGTRIGMLVDFDIGSGRTGLQTIDDTVALAKRVEACQNLDLHGIFCYPGHITVAAAEQLQPLAKVAELITKLLDEWSKHGLNAEIVSSGSTPTAFQSHHVPGLTEIRPGTYIFNDLNVAYGGFCTLDDCAARIHATVVSTAVPDQFVLDAGSKTLTSDHCGPVPDSGYGRVVEYPNAKISKLTEEHGQVRIGEQGGRRPRVGERVTVIPNHVCPTINLQDTIWWHEAGELRPLNVDARGKLI